MSRRAISFAGCRYRAEAERLRAWVRPLTADAVRRPETRLLVDSGALEVDALNALLADRDVVHARAFARTVSEVLVDPGFLECGRWFYRVRPSNGCPPSRGQLDLRAKTTRPRVGQKSKDRGYQNGSSALCRLSRTGRRYGSSHVWRQFRHRTQRGGVLTSTVKIAPPHRGHVMASLTGTWLLNVTSTI
jgi:hypothetical protein